ncbi:MAG: hypothetical protein JW751_20620 [Polyangiaceae bacterium]|nr:hypothetical protein [Polyangiaceae bacterium]
MTSRLFGSAWIPMVFFATACGGSEPPLNPFGTGIGGTTGGGTTGGVSGSGGVGTGAAPGGGTSGSGGVLPSGGGTPTGGTGAGGAVTGGATTGGVMTGGAVTGGTVPTGGVGGGTTGGTSGSGGGEIIEDPIDCTSVSGAGLPVNESGWLDASCNSFGLQGAWYCFTDEIQTSTCASGTPPWQAGSGMCLSGTSVIDEDYKSWGGGIGLSLNETGGEDSVKTAYDAAANNVVGFRITLEGDSLGMSMRVGYSGAADPGDDITPFVEIGEISPGTPLVAEVLIEDAVVPEEWETVPNPGALADPSQIYDIQVQYPGGEEDGEYSFCITNIEPMTTGDVPDVNCNLTGQVWGTSERYGTSEVSGYMIQNNVWNDAAVGHQSISAFNASGGVGFIVHADSGYDVLSDPNGRPGGYGSAVLGWHTDGGFHGSYQSARQISGIGSARSQWNYCTPSAGNWNASYDIWLAPGGAQPSGDQGTELMIWTAHRDATPIGTELDTVTIGGASWEVWVGEDAGPWQTISFRRITNTRTVDIDLKDFFTAGDPYADYDSSHSLYGIQAGFEVWSSDNQNLNFTTALFNASVQ